MNYHLAAQIADFQSHYPNMSWPSNPGVVDPSSWHGDGQFAQRKSL
jgi:hypothetical protein